VCRSERVAARLAFGLSGVLAHLTIVSSFMSTVAIILFASRSSIHGRLLVRTVVTLVNLVLTVGPLAGTGWLLLASARITAAQELGTPTAPTGSLAFRVGLVLLALTLPAVLWLVVSNMVWVAEHDATGLLWINYAFLAFPAMVLGWQFWEV
jgi:hypothetical protein